MNKLIQFVAGVADTIAKKLSHEELGVNYTPIEKRTEHVVQKSPLFARIKWDLLPNLKDEYKQLAEYKEISKAAEDNYFNLCLIMRIGQRRGIEIHCTTQCYAITSTIERFNALHCMDFREIPQHMLERIPDDVNTVFQFFKDHAVSSLVIDKEAPSKATSGQVVNIKQLR